MVMKICVECGKEFNARTSAVTCGPECSKKHHIKVCRDYYLKNSSKWKWYKKNAVKEQVGTTDLVGSAARDDNGDVDFKHEQNLINKELKHLGLR